MRCLRSAQLPAHSLLPRSPPMCRSPLVLWLTEKKQFSVTKVKTVKQQQPKTWLLEAGEQSLMCEII